MYKEEDTDMLRESAIELEKLFKESRNECARKLNERSAYLVQTLASYSKDLELAELDKLEDLVQQIGRRIFRKENLEKTIARRNQDADKNE